MSRRRIGNILTPAYTYNMSDQQQAFRRNSRLFYAINFLENCFFYDAIYVIFGTQYLHLTFLQAGSLFFVSYFVSIVLDFWGGIRADILGRKKAQMLGLAIQLVSLLPYLVTQSYALLLVASVVNGVGVALASNSLHALIYEQATALKTQKLYQRVNAYAQIWVFAGAAVGSLVGGLMYMLDPRLPYGLMVITLGLGIAASAMLRTPVRKSAGEIVENPESVAVMTVAIKAFRSNKTLLDFIVISFLVGIFGDLLFSYYQPYYVNLHVNALTLGLVFGALRVVAGFGSFTMRKLPDVLGSHAIQAMVLLAMTATTIIMLLFEVPIVLFAPIIFAFTQGFNNPNLRLFINNHASDSARTATLSFGTMVTNFGVGLGYLIAFVLADSVSSSVILKSVLLGIAATSLLGIILWRARVKAALS